MSSSRDRIIETASRMVRDQGAAATTMAAVARESGVSRQMVYLHFSSRAGLFSAITHWHDQRYGIRERFARALELEPTAALEGLMREWIAYLPEILPIQRQLHAAFLTGAEGGDVWHERVDEVRRLYRLAARRADLREPWTPETAADWLWTRTQGSVFDEMVTLRGWSPEEFADRTVETTLETLLSPAART